MQGAKIHPTKKIQILTPTVAQSVTTSSPPPAYSYQQPPPYAWNSSKFTNATPISYPSLWKPPNSENPQDPAQNSPITYFSNFTYALVLYKHEILPGTDLALV